MKLYFRFAIIYKIDNNMGANEGRNRCTIMIEVNVRGQGELDDIPT